jgi:hypothetical protein
MTTTDGSGGRGDVPTRKEAAPGRWQKFRELSPPQRRLATAAFFALPLVEIGLRVLGTSRLLRLLERTVPEPQGPLRESSDQHEAAKDAARVIAAVARGGVVRSTCLRRSVFLWWILRRRRVACDLRLGVRREAERVLAHAWVESGPIAFERGDETGRTFEAFA